MQSVARYKSFKDFLATFHDQSALSASSILCTERLIGSDYLSLEEKSNLLGTAYYAIAVKQITNGKVALNVYLRRGTLVYNSVDCLSPSTVISIELLQCTNNRVDYLSLSPCGSKLLVGYGSFILDIRDVVTLTLLSCFDSSLLNTFQSVTKCISADFITGPGLIDDTHASNGDKSAECWVGLALHHCGDPSLSHHFVCWEASQAVDRAVVQSVPLVRKAIRSLAICTRKMSHSFLLACTDNHTIWYYDQEMVSSFAGPMYPPGFTVMSEVAAYIEAEDELDRVVVPARPLVDAIARRDRDEVAQLGSQPNEAYSR